VRSAVAARPGGATILAERDELERHLKDGRDLDLSLLLAERRFERAHDVAALVATAGSSRRSVGDRIDRIVTHRFLGLPVLFGVMWVMFRLVTDVAAPFVDWIDVTLSGTLGPWVAAGLDAVGLGGGWVERLAVDGILGGVGGMLVFVPVIVLLYAMLGVLEDPATWPGPPTSRTGRWPRSGCLGTASYHWSSGSAATFPHCSPPG